MAGLLLMGVVATASNTTFGFASVFHGGAVLQSDVDVAIWGTAEGSSSVTLSLDGNLILTVLVKNGEWKTHIPPHSTAWSSTLTVADPRQLLEQSVSVKFGQVVLCSGQVKYGQ